MMAKEVQQQRFTSKMAEHEQRQQRKRAAQAASRAESNFKSQLKLQQAQAISTLVN